tara:strand:- start:883 stop:1203 length:321 start_codon:yes stop_codon:yes gene_type:complete
MKPICDIYIATKCDNCGAIAYSQELQHISDPGERLYAGETVPAGQCPNKDCGALAHVIEDARARERAELALDIESTLNEWRYKEHTDTEDANVLLTRAMLLLKEQI